MNFKAILIVVAALAFSSMSHAAVECWVICAGANACVSGAEGAQSSNTGTGAWKIGNCDKGEKRAQVSSTVWYTKDALPAVAELPKDALLSKVIVGADPSCAWLDCLINVKPTQVAGVHPIGPGAAADVPRPIVDAGLPFDQVAIPPQGLSFRVEGAAASGGSFSLSDLSGKPLGTFPAEGGVVRVPPQLLKPGEAYNYVWTAPDKSLKGGFMVARDNTVKRAADRAKALAASNPTPANERFALASAYLSAGLIWNGRKLLVDIERGE